MGGLPFSLYILACLAVPGSSPTSALSLSQCFSIFLGPPRYLVCFCSRLKDLTFDSSDRGRYTFRVICSLISLSVLIALAILLIRGGIEPNPGPVDQLVPEFSIISQNCRGLTECKKVCRLIKRLTLSKAKPLPKIVCLQETHCINRFALDNFLDGEYIVDDGEIIQRGVAILVPKAFQICQSSTSGLGR